MKIINVNLIKKNIDDLVRKHYKLNSVKLFCLYFKYKHNNKCNTEYHDEWLQVFRV